MEQFLLQQAIKLNNQRKRRLRWKRFVRSVAMVVVFCTTYALILPAITMQTEMVCGMQEHSHADVCYVPELACLSDLSADTTVHSHNELCYGADGELRCTLPERVTHEHTEDCYSRKEIMVCRLEETEGHTHGDACYEIAEEPACGLEERQGHAHEDACYGAETLICLLEENQGHVHEESCYEMQQTLTCTEEACEAHTHGEDCFVSETVNICNLEECQPHTHTESCYTEQSHGICGLEESEPHTHGENCYEETITYICGQEEQLGHTHGDGCYEESRDCTCGLEESEEHSHSDACYTVTSVLCCTTPESEGHSHTDSCCRKDQNLICTVTETEGHTHTEACYESEQVLSCEMPETEGHTHGDSCWEERINQICTLAETAGHTHGETCYTETPVAVCGQEACDAHEHGPECYERPLICQLEESEGHTHSDECHKATCICALEEKEPHSHGESCVEVEEELLCEIPEIILHTHSETCRDENGELICGQPEYILHIHTEECVTQRLVCETQEHIHEESCYPVQETAPTDPGFFCGYGRHSHSEGCYDAEGILCCSIPEHSHEAACFVEGYDPDGDVETEADWMATFASVSLTGSWPEDVLAIAGSQLGYRESTNNVVLQEDGTLKGYTRYGAWYGSPYGDWCAMFVSFCMRYAGVEYYPLEAGCPEWVQKLEAQGFYRQAEVYTPKKGDIIFFDGNGDGSADHVGLVTKWETEGDGIPAQIHTVEGNAGDRVQNCSYDADDPAILGYGVMSVGNHASLSVRGEDCEVTVHFGADARIPGDAQLVVQEIRPGTQEYADYYAQSVQAIQLPEDPDAVQEISFARFFDISFLANGCYIEPSAPVNITITYDDAVEIAQEDTGLAIHFAEDGIEILDAETNEEPSDPEKMADTFTFTQDSFSVTGTVITGNRVPKSAGGIDLSNAQKLTDAISTIQVRNGIGAETRVFANGDTFTIIMEGTLQSYLFSNGQPKTFYFNLSDTMRLTGYTCSDGISNALIDGGSNTFLMVVNPVSGSNGYQPVQFRVELQGQAINQTGGVAYVTIRWDQYQVYSSKQEFTGTGSDGTVVKVQLMGSSYSPSQYDLVVNRVDASGYLNNIRNYLNQNYSRRDLAEAALYQIWLQNKSNPNDRKQLPSPYVLALEYPEGGLAVPSGGQSVVINMNNGSPNKPSGFSAETYGGYVTKAAISDQYSSLSQFAVVSLTGITEGTTGSGYSLQINDQADAFIKDPAYAAYYNENSPIGTAGSFHIVAFDTANLDTHTNGNVLAKNLYANSNFGTNNYGHELTYVQNYCKVNPNSASKAEHILVIGSENELGLYDNNNKYSVNGQPIDRPKNLVQDRSTSVAPFIDLNRVRAEISQIAAKLVGYPDMNLDITIMDQKHVISLTDPDAVGILNVKPTDSRIFGEDYLQMAGFQSGHEGSIVINVDCTGVTEINMPKALVVVDGVEQGTNEVVEFSNGKVLWNFINAQGVTINTHLMTGMVIAPGATVNVMQNLNGTVVADVVNIKAESHRTDFTGKIVPNTSTETHSVTIQKIRAGYVGTTLANAHFDLYIWNGSGWSKANTDAIITDSTGLFLMENLKINTAYKLVETVAPAGYVLMEEPYYFWVREKSDATSPTLKPNGFSGKAVSSGGILNITNELDEEVTTTSIELEKVWDTEETVHVDRVTVSVYQLSWNEGTLIGKHLYKTVTLTKTLNWKSVVSDLPLNGKTDGGTAVTYTYAVEEVQVEGYIADYSIDNATGISGGSVTITNRPESEVEQGYVLPETGGIGNQFHIFGGTLLTVFAVIYLYLLSQKRRREAAY